MKKLILAALISVVTAQASAAVVFSDRSAWTNAVTNVSTVDFEGYATATSYSYKGSSFASGGVNFTAAQGMYVIGQNYSESGGTFGFNTGASLFSYSFGISGVLPGNFNAFGVNLRGYAEASTPFTITFSDGEVFNLTATNPTGAFFGVFLNNQINGFKIDPAGNYVDIDNLSYARTTVPEPTTVALLGLGLLGFAASRRKSANSKNA